MYIGREFKREIEVDSIFFLETKLMKKKNRSWMDL